MSDEGDRAAMMLPEGKTCADCVHIRRCTMFGFTPTPEETMCSFGPSRFRASSAPGEGTVGKEPESDRSPSPPTAPLMTGKETTP